MKPPEELTKGGYGLESPYDMEACYGAKRGKDWIGYKVHYTETCDEDTPHLITHVDTTTANVSDAVRIQSIHEALECRQLLPSQHWMDAGYVSSEALYQAKSRFKLQLIGPPRGTKTWRKKPEDQFDLRDFTIFWDEQKVICPQGEVSKDWNESSKREGHSAIKVRFSTQSCKDCPVQEKCKKTPGPRQMSLAHQGRQEALQEARDFMSSPEGKELYHLRAGVESLFSEGVRVCGLRRSRYRGLKKTHAQNVFVALALNQTRLCQWMSGDRPARPKPSHLSRHQQMVFVDPPSPWDAPVRWPE